MFRAVSAAVPLAMCCAPLLGQWTATRLHPSGSYSTSVNGVSASQQAGFWQATQSSLTKPVYWSGSSGSMVNLAPGASDLGELYGVSGSTQFGWFGNPTI